MLKLLLCIALVLSGACSHNERRDTIAATVLAADSASAALVAYDARHQAQIVKDAATLEDGQSALAAYRERRGEVVTFLVAIYRAAALASLASDEPLSTLRKAQARFSAALNSLTGGTIQ